MKHVAAAKPAAEIRITGLLALGVMTVCFGALLWRLTLFLDLGVQAIRYPNELDYGEGIVWQQMRAILAGHGYAPIDGFPAIVFHYTPVFHVVTGLTARLGGFSELAAGRAVEVISTLAAGLFVGLIAGLLAPQSSRPARLVCGSAAGLIGLSCWPVSEWGSLMRVDMIAMAFSLAGLYLAMRSLDRPRLIHLAGLAFVTAVFAKQSAIAAPAAAYAVLLVLRPRLALAGIATSVAAGLAVLLTLTWATDGGFVRHVFLYNVNRFNLQVALKLFSWIAFGHVVYFGLAVVGIGCCLAPLVVANRHVRSIADLRRRLAAEPAHARVLIGVCYVGLAHGTILMAGKSGASFNYLIELMLAVSIFAGLTVRFAADAMFPAPGRLPVARPAWVRFAALPLAICIIPLAITWQAAMIRRPDIEMKVRSAAQRAEYAQLSGMVRAAQRPIISDDMVLLIQNGKPVVWEPAIFAELASMGRYDEQRIVRMIRGHAFAFFVTDGDRGYKWFDERYNPPVVDAMDAAYPRKLKLAGHLVHLPAEPAQRLGERDDARLRGPFTSRQY